MNNTGTAIKRRTKSIIAAISGAYVSFMCTLMTAYAGFGDTTVKVNEPKDVDGMMGKVIGILLDITRWAGVALAVYGVYEIVMSFMQNQPEAKTKGVIMTLSGVVMVTLKTILQTLQLVS